MKELTTFFTRWKTSCLTLSFRFDLMSFSVASSSALRTAFRSRFISNFLLRGTRESSSASFYRMKKIKIVLTNFHSNKTILIPDFLAFIKKLSRIAKLQVCEKCFDFLKFQFFGVKKIRDQETVIFVKTRFIFLMKFAYLQYLKIRNFV